MKKFKVWEVLNSRFLFCIKRFWFIFFFCILNLMVFLLMVLILGCNSRFLIILIFLRKFGNFLMDLIFNFVILICVFLIFILVVFVCISIFLSLIVVLFNCIFKELLFIIVIDLVKLLKLIYWIINLWCLFLILILKFLLMFVVVFWLRFF